MNTRNDKILAIAKRTFEPKTRKIGEVRRIIITAKVVHLEENSHPYFSVTADIWYVGGGSGGGCAHEDCLRFWPECKPIIDLHLSNADNGEPMHGAGNGWYWLAGAYGGLGERYHGGNSDPIKSPDACWCNLAEHVRMDVQSLKSWCEPMVVEGKRSATADNYYVDITTHRGKESTTNRCIHKNKAIGHHTRLAFIAWIDRQRERWANEAKAGVALIRSLSE